VVDLLKQAVLAAALACAADAGPVADAKRRSLVAVCLDRLDGFQPAGAAHLPTFIARFNASPSSRSEPAGRIEALLRRCGFRASGLYVMDGSKRSSHATPISRLRAPSASCCSTAAVAPRAARSRAVLAHELGHTSATVWKRVALLFGLSAACCGASPARREAWFYDGLGVRAAAPRLRCCSSSVLPVFTFFLQPIRGLYSPA